MLSRKTPSRLASESRRGEDATTCDRSANRPKESTSTTTRNHRSTGPIADWVKLCTETMTPERVRNVPRMVRANVAITSTKFQACSMPRRSCTTAEWRNAVAVSQGRNDAFSTGSHAQ